MKILITTDAYVPMVNGVVTSVNNLYKELKYNGHDVKILTLSHNSEERVEGDIYYLKSIGVGVYPEARIKVPLYNKLIDQIIKWSPDIIHSQTEFSMMLVAKHISNRLNIPHIHTYHTLYENYLDYLLGGKVINKSRAAKITKLLLNSLDAVIAPTQKTKDVLLGYGVIKPIYVVPTGIDLARFKQNISIEDKRKIKLTLGLSESDRIIAYVGRVAEEKNISEILRLFKQVIEKEKNIKLLIVGTGPYLNCLKTQVKKENIQNNVVFTGMIKPEEVYKYYKLAEIFVTASISETQGLTYIEALSSGCPIVCKEDSCIEGVVRQGINGFSYKEKDEFFYYISRILKDNKLRNNMTKEAVNTANKYSSRTFANNMIEIYCRVMCAKEEENIEMLKLTENKI
ncbi:1,2-diacylglycerol 3-glucosyltransferase [Clostridium cavendishii DSM 21758]|uniref:1,2-diacylglycerol 3-glucosyltransferase n=1 Tax=Clostridium cavendishii DSM 21758 TaxID=1121302 RepID=A0A1M6RAL4_9CLOT|nr:glycosyltransferase family 4 protein [Clostridium cavendishii]SHK29378.1 1,2-diacylglycerol 3-glucosyltransferase [Clostridium cavendishii DSM 21758]